MTNEFLSLLLLNNINYITGSACNTCLVATVIEYVKEGHNRAFPGGKLQPLLKGQLIVDQCFNGRIVWKIRNKC